MKRLTNAVILLLGLSMAIMTSCTKDPDNGGNSGNNGGGNNGNTYNGHEYVDLGLPSGTLWATCNVGATTSEIYGDRFAWGETQPKTTYTWSNYKYSNGGDDDNPNLTKYSLNSIFGCCGYNGFVDDLSTLLSEDDAATANWGSGWCTPTKAEYKELLQYCVWTQTIQNGVKGILFTASNGNSLFFPNYKDGTGGAYWTNSLHESCYQAVCFWFESNMNMASVDAERRYVGHYVRPVRSSH